MVAWPWAAMLLAVSAGGDTVLLDFQADWCGPCRQVAPTVNALAAAGYPVRRVNVDQERELASRFRVTAVPCFVMVREGREVGRIAGPASRPELEALLAKGGARPGRPVAGRAATHAHPHPGPRGEGAGRTDPFRKYQSPDPAAALAREQPDAEVRGAAIENVSAAPGAAAPPASLADRLIHSSVRLSIEDPHGVSYGTGTIVDAREGEALVLTCGHVFRDSHGKGRISVDQFSAGARQKLTGQVLAYDLPRDVGLVSFRPGGQVQVARVAPRGYRLEQGARVVSVGCNHGQDATIEEGTILAVNKFVGEPNVQVSGQPVQGRSGGGLFSADGLVIGVCNAADPTDNAGLYAALPAIQDKMDEMELSEIYQPRGQPREEVIELANGAAPAGGEQPATVPIRPAALVPEAHGEPAAVPLKALSSAERAAVQEIERRTGSAEVICIVRPLGDPAGRSEMFVLDQASPAFQQLLAASRAPSGASRLTAVGASRPTSESTRRAPPPSDAARGSVHFYRR